MLKTPPNTATRTNKLDPIGRERLLLENLSEVRFLARRIHGSLPSCVPFDDLFHTGILGLIEAVDKFDPQKNVQLRSYARFRIRGAILDGLREMDWSPRNLRKQARRIEEANRKLTGELGRAPSEPEIAFELGLPLETFQQLLCELRSLRLVSLTVESEDAITDVDSPRAVRPEEDPFEATFRGELHTRLAEALSELNEKEEQVLGLYYLEDLTMKEVGTILGIGESRVSQIHSKVLNHLRLRLRDQFGNK